MSPTTLTFMCDVFSSNVAARGRAATTPWLRPLERAPALTSADQGLNWGDHSILLSRHLYHSFCAACIQYVFASASDCILHVYWHIVSFCTSQVYLCLGKCKCNVNVDLYSA